MANQIAFGLMAVVLATAAATDWRTGKVYNWLTYPGMLGGLAFWTVAGYCQGGSGGAIAGLGASGLAMLLALVPFTIVFRYGALGGGDVKLLGAVGALSASWQCVLGTVVYGFVIALIMAIYVMVRRRIVLRTLGRVLGAMIALSASIRPDLPEDSPRIPLGVAFKIGGLLAGADYLLHLPLPGVAR